MWEATTAVPTGKLVAPNCLHQQRAAERRQAPTVRVKLRDPATTFAFTVT